MDYRPVFSARHPMPTISEALAIAMAQHQAGQLDLAEEIYGRILALEPDHAEALHLTGVAAHQRGAHQRAVEYVSRAIAADGTKGYFHNTLGEAYRALHNIAQALQCYERAIHTGPDCAEYHNSLGLARQGLGQLAEAASCFRQAAAMKPDFAEAHNNLGNVRKDQGDLDEAIACYRRTLELRPGLAGVHYNLGTALHDQGKVSPAIACYRRALELAPESAEAHGNLGNALKDQGRLVETVACYRRAVELKPTSAAAHSNLVYALYFCPECDAAAIYAEHRRWNRAHAEPLAGSIGPHANDRSPDRRLRVGYLSPNFREHVVGRNLVPLLGEHDHRAYEIFGYCDLSSPDTLTQRLRASADVWREIARLSDQQVAELIRADGIDVLVDLTLHLDGNRLPVFARKPAPVQVTFAGYPGTTGLSAIDYRLTDPYLDPPGLDDRYYSEHSIRLRDSFWCYDPLRDEPAVSRLPARARGYVTFGCLNNFCKVNPPVLKLWAEVLRSVDRSRLLLLAAEGTHRQRTLDLLAAEGVSADRVIFAAGRPRDEYLKLYHQVDIGLDTFPYNGHTTSLDAFWMGVPVITLVGQTVVGRAGLSQLTNLSLPELAADSPEQFVRTALETATDLPRLASLRESLRDRMKNSPLMDAPRFARSVEAEYRAMWQRWCNDRTAGKLAR